MTDPRVQAIREPLTPATEKRWNGKPKLGYLTLTFSGEPPREPESLRRMRESLAEDEDLGAARGGRDGGEQA